MTTAFRMRSARRKKSIFLRVLWIILFGGLLFIAGQEAYYRVLLTKEETINTVTKPFIIQKHELPTTVASKLVEEHILPSSWAFLRYAKRSGDAENFQAGKFYIAPHTSLPALSRVLTKAAPKEISVTIPEGYTNADIDILLTDLGLIKKGGFLKCLRECDFSNFPFLPKDPELREGFFFPDTYFVSPDNFSVEAFAKRLLKNFDEKTKKIFGTAKRNGWDILKMASIVEKESRKAEERPIVAGILWKRLDNDWTLGADATTRYITGKQQEALTVEDLALKSPWNTRASRGLPPGAICNPGLDAIRAAAYPKETEYWYYLHASDGNIYYAKTEAEHNTNKYKYLRQ